MLGENETNVTAEGTEASRTAAATTEPKKRRAGRPKKMTGAALSELSAKPARRGRRKRSDAVMPIEMATVANVAAPAIVKARRKNHANKPAVPKAEATVVGSDEFADLVQLEGENKRLRKALAEKLRSENADLRKRLGLNG